MSIPLIKLVTHLERVAKNQIATTRQLEQTSARESLYASAIDGLYELIERMDLTPFGGKSPEAIRPPFTNLDWSNTAESYLNSEKKEKFQSDLLDGETHERLMKVYALGTILGSTEFLCRAASVFHRPSFAEFVLATYQMDPRFRDLTFELVQADLDFRVWLDGQPRVQACLRMFDAIREFMAGQDQEALREPLARISVDLDAMTSRAEQVPVELRKRLMRMFADRIIKTQGAPDTDLVKAFFKQVFPAKEGEGMDPWQLVSDLCRSRLVIEALGPDPAGAVAEFYHTLKCLQRGVIKKQLEAGKIKIFGDDIQLLQTPLISRDNEKMLAYMNSPQIKDENERWLSRVTKLNEDVEEGRASRELYFDVKRLGASVEGYSDVASQFIFYAYSR